MVVALRETAALKPADGCVPRGSKVTQLMWCQRFSGRTFSPAPSIRRGEVNVAVAPAALSGDKGVFFDTCRSMMPRF